MRVAATAACSGARSPARVEIGATRVGPRAVEIARQRRAGRRGRHQRRGEQRVDVHLRIGELVHEDGVGAVLQQPAHQVGEQVAVLAHRRVDAHRHVGLSHQLAVHTFAHAVQALHLEAAAGGLRPSADGGDGAGVVGGELRIDQVRVREQGARRRGRRCRCGACA